MSDTIQSSELQLVRGSVAKNPNASNYIQDILSEDASEYVQRCLNEI